MPPSSNMLQQGPAPWSSAQLPATNERQIPWCQPLGKIGRWHSRHLKNDNNFFMPPRSKIGGILFLSCLSLCNSVLILETLTLLITFEQWVLELWYFTWVFFSWVPLFFTLWPWPWSLTYFLKTLTLLITLEQWVLEHWYLTWVFLVIRPFRGFIIFLRTYYTRHT